MGGRRHRGKANKATAFASCLGIVRAVRNICRRLGGMAVNRTVIMHVNGAKTVVILRQAVSLTVAKRENRRRSKKTKGIERGHSGRGPQSHLAGQRSQHPETITPFPGP
jgi:hypothetical protein